VPAQAAPGTSALDCLRGQHRSPPGSAEVVAMTSTTSSNKWWYTFAAVGGLIVLVLLLLRVMSNISRRWSKMMQARVEKAIKERNRGNDFFRRENGYSWDFVLVFKVRHINETLTVRQERFSLKAIVQALADAGLQSKLFYSVQHDEVYCKIRAPLARLCKEAERTKMMLELEPSVVGLLLREGHKIKSEDEHERTEEQKEVQGATAATATATAAAATASLQPWQKDEAEGKKHKEVRVWGPISIPFTNFETTIEPYDYIYAPYTSEMAQRRLYKTSSALGESECFLRFIDRLKLISSILAVKVDDGG